MFCRMTYGSRALEWGVVGEDGAEVNAWAASQDGRSPLAVEIEATPSSSRGLMSDLGCDAGTHREPWSCPQRRWLEDGSLCPGSSAVWVSCGGLKCRRYSSDCDLCADPEGCALCGKRKPVIALNVGCCVPVFGLSGVVVISVSGFFRKRCRVHRSLSCRSVYCNDYTPDVVVHILARTHTLRCPLSFHRPLALTLARRSRPHTSSQSMMTSAYPAGALDTCRRTSRRLRPSSSRRLPANWRSGSGPTRRCRTNCDNRWRRNNALGVVLHSF